MSAVQMNVRLDDALKASGDAVLARYGYTPSQVVRAVWEQLVLGDRIPAVLKHRLDQRRFDEGRDEARGSVEEDEGIRLVTEFYRRFDISEPAESFDYETLREEAAEERLREWELS